MRQDPGSTVSTDDLLKSHEATSKPEGGTRDHRPPSLDILEHYSHDEADTAHTERAHEMSGKGKTIVIEMKSSTPAKNYGEDLPAYTLRELEVGDGTVLAEHAAEAERERRPGGTTWLGIYQACWQWKAEVVFLALSLLSLMAIVILLVKVDGTAQHDWLFFFSLNTVISIVGTISRASLATAVGSCLAQEKWNWFLKRQDNLLMFDRIEKASRGELGSAELLIRLKFRYWASLGAGIVVIMLAYDPFIQALVDQSGQLNQLGSTGTAKLATAQRLDVGILVDGTAVYTWDWRSSDNSSSCTRTTKGLDFFSQPALGMISSVYDGFSNISTSTTRTPISACTSGNCTWPHFASLAVCGSCRDVSQHIQSSTEYVSSLTETGNQTTFFLPLNNITGIDTGAVVNMVGKLRARDGAYSSPASMTAMGTIDASRLITFANSTTFLLGFSIIHADQAFLNGNVEWNASRPTATECGLELCTNIYASKVEQGELSETVLSSSVHRDPQSLRPGLRPIDADSEAGCEEMWHAVVDESLWYEPELVGNMDRTDLRLYVPDDEAATHGITGSTSTAFNVTDVSLRSTLSWMKDQFTTQQLIWYNNLDDVEAHAGLTDGTTFWSQAPIASALASQPGLEGTFKRVADSMTTWMRNIDFDQEPVAGTTWAWNNHIRVIWAYIAFPIVTTLAGVVYCLAVIFETRYLGLKPWTDSCLATMAYGIGDDTRARLQQARDIKKEASNVHMGARWARGWKECSPLEPL